MMRSWVFTFLNASQWYNLWKDFILPTISDPTFGNSPFVPSKVCAVQIQSQSASVNANNGGAGLTVDYSGAKGGGTDLVSGQADRQSSTTNSIELQKINLLFDTAGAGINVTITAL